MVGVLISEVGRLRPTVRTRNGELCSMSNGDMTTKLKTSADCSCRSYTQNNKQPVDDVGTSVVDVDGVVITEIHKHK